MTQIQALTKRIRNRGTTVLRSESSFPIDRLLASVTASSIERYKDGKVALFMCQVSASCPSDELRMNRTPTRMDLDPLKGNVRIWLMGYNPRKPDVVIENVVAPAK